MHADPGNSSFPSGSMARPKATFFLCLATLVSLVCFSGLRTQQPAFTDYALVAAVLLAALLFDFRMVKLSSAHGPITDPALLVDQICRRQALHPVLL